MTTPSRHPANLNRLRWLARIPPKIQALLIVAIYLAAWTALDFWAFYFESAPEIQIWYPPSALDVVLLLVFGLRYWPALLLNTLIHTWVVTGRHLPFLTLLIFDLTTTFGYLGACILLLRTLRINARMRELRDVVWFILVAGLVTPFGIAILQVVNFHLSGVVRSSDWLINTFQYFAGDATGIGMLAPFLLVLLRQFPELWANRELERPLSTERDEELHLPSWRNLPMLILHIFLLSGGIWIGFATPRGVNLDYTYFVFLPLVWIALQYGFPRATETVLAINLGVIFLAGTQIGAARTLVLQFGLLAITDTGVILGALSTERKRTIISLKQANEHLESRVTERTAQLQAATEAADLAKNQITHILESITDAFFAIDHQGRISYLNRRAEQVLRRNGEELIGKIMQDEFPETLGETFYQQYQQAVSQNMSVKFEAFSVPLKTWFEVHTYPLLGGISVYFHDITQRKAREEALRLNMARYRSLVAASTSIVWTAQADGQIEEMPQWRAYTGQSEAAVEGWGWLEAVHPKDRDRTIEAWNQAVATKSLYQTEYRLLGSDGNYRDFAVLGVAILDRNGNILEWVGSCTDISERKRAEIEIFKAAERERALSELRSNFVSLVSHEFRTPLTTILSSAQMLERYGERLSPEKKASHHQRIQSAVFQMTQLLDDLLIIGQAEDGKFQFNPQPLDLVAFCRDLVEEIQMIVNTQHLCHSHQHQIIFAHFGECTDARLDEKLLRQTLTNLLSNAVKYSTEGGAVQFDLVCTDKEAVFRIQDYGIGIPEQDLPRLFESFSRCSNVGSIPGTGLGLAIAKKSLDLHSGQISVTSIVGVGTTFTLPLYQTAQE